MRLVLAASFVALVGGASACSLLLDTSDANDDGTSGDGGASSSSSGTSGASSSGAGGDGGELRDGPASTACDGPCPPEQIADVVDPRDIVADESGVYWNDNEKGDVFRAPPVGKPVATLFDGQAAPTQMARGANRIFWTEMGAGRVRAIAKDATLGNLAIDVSGEDNPAEIAVSDAMLWWVSRTTGIVRRLDSTNPNNAPSAIGNTPNGTWVIGMRTDAQWVYVGVSGDVNRVQRFSRSAPTVALEGVTPLVGDLRAFTLADGRLYYTSGTEGLVASTNVTGNDPIVHATKESAPRGVAVDDFYVYWTNQTQGAIRRAPRSGGSAETIATGQAAPFRIAVNSHAIYWLNQDDGAVMMLRK